LHLRLQRRQSLYPRPFQQYVLSHHLPPLIALDEAARTPPTIVTIVTMSIQVTVGGLRTLKLKPTIRRKY